MTADPMYTDVVYNRPRRPREEPGTPENVEDRLRRFVMWGDQPDGIILDAADAIRDTLKQLAAADARVKILEAEHAAMRADRDRLHAKLSRVGQLLEPQAWAEGSRNRTQLMEVLYDGVPAPVERTAAP